MSSSSRQLVAARRQPWLTSIVSGGLLAFVAIVWIVAAPVQLGGPAAYVVVTGNSMEPNLHDGDLAIVRTADQYRPGDVVAYQHPDIGPVIHRIQGTEGARFVLQGDNNSWVDGYNPTTTDLIGGLWLLVPRVGAVMEGIRASGWLPVVGGVGGLIVMLTFFGSSKQPPRRKPSARPIRGGALGETAQSVLTALGMGLSAFTLLACFSFAQPVEHAGQQDIAFQQSGRFTYTADTPGTVLYDSGRVTTGDPVFRKLSSQVDVSFDYHFATQSAFEVRGMQRLVAVLTDNNGWKRTLSLTPEAPFEGDSFTVRGSLSLDAVQDLVDTLEAETGIKRDHHELYLVPEVRASGVVAGQPFSDAFEPRLGFRFDSFNLQMLPPGPREPDPRAPVQQSSVQLPRMEANSLPVLGGKLSIGDARRLALFGIVLSVAAGLVFGLYVLRPVTSDEPSRIQERLGEMLISVRAGTLETGRAVDVESIDDLAKLAERAGGTILHTVQGKTHEYGVQDGQVTYRYQAFARRGDASPTAAGSPVAGDLRGR
jgi:signal peptidase